MTNPETKTLLLPVEAEQQRVLAELLVSFRSAITRGNVDDFTVAVTVEKNGERFTQTFAARPDSQQRRERYLTPAFRQELLEHVHRAKQNALRENDERDGTS